MSHAQDLVMPTIPTIICPVDFSDHSRTALARAWAWARYFRTRLVVVTVAEPLLVNAAAAAYDMNLVREEMLPELREFVEGAVARGPDMAPPDVMVLVGEPAAEIVAFARQEHADLVVMATHGLSGYRKMLLGSTTERVLGQTTVPVLVAPPSEHTPAVLEARKSFGGGVLAPVDFKPECVTEVRVAADIAQTLGVPLLLVHVVAPVKGIERLRPHLERHNGIQIERASQQIQELVSVVGRSMDIETVVAVGSPAEEIAHMAVARDVALIVMGLRTQENMFGPRPGSMAYRVLGLAPVMVLTLPPGQAEADWLRRLVNARGQSRPTVAIR